MAYFEGIRSGDKIYNSEGKEFVVEQVYGNGSFHAKDFGEVSARGYSVNFEQLGQVAFWQPPAPVIAPPRPQRKVTKWLKGWISKYRREDGTDFNVFYDDYESAESAATYKLFPRIACVEINVPYEVEE